jgi:glutamate 5-kinase
MTDADRPVKRIVVKFGSGVLTLDSGSYLQVDRNVVYSLAAELSEAIEQGVEVIVVSSGAIALGVEEIELAECPEPLCDVQAMAAVGQSLLMVLWGEAFGRKNLRVGQVLLTHSDLSDRQRYLNVRATLESLLSYGVVPIVNENDTVMTDEITVGDNDQLAAQVAKLIGADTLLLLTTVDGVLDDEGQVIDRINLEDDPESFITDDVSRTGRGGMLTKLIAGQVAAHGGISVSIGNGKKPGTIHRAIRREPAGTQFEFSERTLVGRKHWIAYTLRVQGSIRLDEGATAAIVDTGASVLPVGIVAVDGSFEEGDLISIENKDGKEVARGLTRIGAEEMASSMGKKGQPVIHRDDMVMSVER